MGEAEGVRQDMRAQGLLLALGRYSTPVVWCTVRGNTWTSTGKWSRGRLFLARLVALCVHALCCKTAGEDGRWWGEWDGTWRWVK